MKFSKKYVIDSTTLGFDLYIFIYLCIYFNMTVIFEIKSRLFIKIAPALILLIVTHIKTIFEVGQGSAEEV